VLHCAVVCCSVLQCVAVCCGVLQCVSVCCSGWYAEEEEVDISKVSSPLNLLHKVPVEMIFETSYLEEEKAGEPQGNATVLIATSHICDMTHSRVGHDSFTCGT